MKLPSIILLLVIVLSSCSTSEHVISGRKFQKRKYQKGLHVHNKSKKKPIILKEEKEETPSKSSKKESTELPQILEAEIPLAEHPIVVKEKKVEPKKTPVKPVLIKEDTGTEDELTTLNELPKAQIKEEEPKVNVHAYISLGGFLLMIIDSLSVFSGALSLIGFLLALIFGIIAISDAQRDKKGTAIAKGVLLALTVLAMIFLFAIIVFAGGLGGDTVLLALAILLAVVLLVLFFAT